MRECLGRRSARNTPTLSVHPRTHPGKRRGDLGPPGHCPVGHPLAAPTRPTLGGRGNRRGFPQTPPFGEGPLLRSFQPEPIPNGIPPILFARSPGGESAGDEPIAPRLCRSRHLLQPTLTPLPTGLPSNHGTLPATASFF